jgi:hypothetical protein
MCLPTRALVVSLGAGLAQGGVEVVKLDYLAADALHHSVTVRVIDTADGRTTTAEFLTHKPPVTHSRDRELVVIDRGNRKALTNVGEIASDGTAHFC